MKWANPAAVSKRCSSQKHPYRQRVVRDNADSIYTGAGEIPPAAATSSRTEQQAGAGGDRRQHGNS